LEIWRNQETDKYRYIPLHDHQRTKEPNVPKVNHTKEMLKMIFKKVERSYKVLKDLKNDFSTLTHSISIKQLKTHLCQLSTYLNQRQKRALPSDTIPNPKNDC